MSEAAGVDLKSCEAAFIDALERQQEGLWDAGAAVVAAMKASATHAPDLAAARAGRTRIFGHFAGVGGCTKERVRQLAETFLAFGETPRARDHSWSWHRAVLLAARRANRGLGDVLEEALGQGWGMQDLRHVGNGHVPTRVGLDRTCAACKAHVHIRVDGDLAAWGRLPIRCPVCAGRCEADGLTREHAERLGTLGPA